MQTVCANKYYFLGDILPFLYSSSQELTGNDERDLDDGQCLKPRGYWDTQIVFSVCGLSNISFCI